MTQDQPPTTRISLLGDLRIVTPSGVLPQIGTRKARALLGYLVLHAGTSRSRESLSDLLWPEAPAERGRQSVRQALHTIGEVVNAATLPEARFTLSRDTVRLDLGTEIFVDVGEIDDLLDTCLAHPHRRADGCGTCGARLERAITLYRGPLLEDSRPADTDTFNDWVEARHETIRRRVVDATLAAARHRSRRGESAHVDALVEQGLALDPWNEDLVRVAITAAIDAGASSRATQFLASWSATLERDIGSAPEPETEALLHDYRPVTRPQVPAPGNPFIGRRAELATLCERLERADCRLATIVGPGGSGKTSLALAAADQSRAAFDAVTLVHVDDGDDPAAVVARIVEAAESRGGEHLAILDGAPSDGSTAALLSREIARRPHLVVLATAREPLGAREEWRFHLGSMGWADHEADAPRLLLDRFRRAGYTPGPDAIEWNEIVRICRLVDGLPLALDLAARWFPGLSVHEIADELAADTGLLSAGDHARLDDAVTLDRVIAGSWERLTDRQRTITADLALCEGGWTRDAAREIAHASTVDLAQLVERSIVRRIDGDRYQMDTWMRHAALRSRDADPASEREAAARHSAYYLDVLAPVAPPLDRDLAIALGAELPNILKAWSTAVTRREWAVERACEPMFEMCAAAERYQEGLRAFGDLIETLDPPIAASRSISRARVFAAECRRQLGDLNRARELAAVAVDDGELDDRLTSIALRVTGQVMHEERSLVEAGSILHHALDLASAANDIIIIGRAGMACAAAALDRGDARTAFRSARIALDATAGVDPPLAISATIALARAALLAGRITAATALAERAIEDARGDPHGDRLATALAVRCDVALTVGDASRAAALAIEGLSGPESARRPQSTLGLLARLACGRWALGQGREARQLGAAVAAHPATARADREVIMSRIPDLDTVARSDLAADWLSLQDLVEQALISTTRDGNPGPLADAEVDA